MSLHMYASSQLHDPPDVQGRGSGFATSCCISALDPTVQLSLGACR